MSRGSKVWVPEEQRAGCVKQLWRRGINGGGRGGDADLRQREEADVLSGGGRKESGACVVGG
jgi:hypothetical protein